MEDARPERGDATRHLSTKQTFRVPSPERELEFTGERFTTMAQGEVRHEHLHRYFFARQFCAGKKVLDIASGEGYGSALLAAVAGEVTGVDRAAEAIRHAAKNYRAPNLKFVEGEAGNIPLPAGSVDVVVSFETLEHLGEQEEFLREIRRVLRPEGVLVMSTPDRGFFASSPPNPFHVKELGKEAFESLLGGHFRNSVVLLQSSVTGSLILPDVGGGSDERSCDRSYEGFRRVRDDVYEVAAGLPAPMYRIGVASDEALPQIRVGAFDDREFQLGLYAELQRRHVEMLRGEAEIEAAAARETRLKQELERLREERETGRIREELARTDAEGYRKAVGAVEAMRAQGRAEARQLRQQRDQLDASLAQTTAEAAQLRDERNQLAAALARTTAEAGQLREDRDQWSAALARTAVERDEWRRNAGQLREQADAIRGSLSWLASAPLRWLGKPAALVLAVARKAMYATPAFAYSGKPLAQLLSRVNLPGARWLLPENPLFDAAFYRQRYPDAAAGSRNVWAHYLAYGSAESRDPHPLFKNDFYRRRNPDAADVNPLMHYLEYGAREGRDPSPEFDTSYYVEQYPDVPASGINPLLHFAIHGNAEGRRAAPPAMPLIRAVLPPAEAEEGAAGPLISLLMPAFNTPAKYLRLAIESVLRQSYREWELCIYDDGSSLAGTLEILREYKGRDPRIRVQFGEKNLGIASATNQAMALAAGRYITMLDHDDEIAPDALLEVANALNGDAGIDALYTDQAFIEADGRMGEPFYKPDWSVDMFRGVMFVGHLLVVRRSLAVELGGFDAAFDRVQDFEFMLRLSERTGKIHHLPKVLYYWRRIPGSVAFHGDQKGAIEPLQAAAVNAHLERMRIPAIAEPHPALAHRLVINPARRTGAPGVSIVVREGPGRDATVASILQRSSYGNFQLNADPGAEYLLWVEAGLEVLTPDWIEHLLLYGEQAQIACVSPLLLNADGTVWHAGLVLGMDGLVGYPMRGLEAGADGYAGSLSCAREVSCVSGECMMISRRKLEALGGMVAYYRDSLYQGADLSLRALTAGMRNIATPRPVLRRTAASETAGGAALDRALFADRWSAVAALQDRYYNPNFRLASPGYEARELVLASTA